MKPATVMCAYCGIRPGVENEHVVGKVFYVDKPKHGITIRSCADCNRKRGDGGPRDIHLDEEYMRNVLCLAEGTQNHPVAAELSNTKVVSSFGQSKGLAKSIAKASGLTEFKTPGGLYEPYSSPFFFPEWLRIQRVLRKITKGLYFWSTDTRFPDDYVVLVNPAVRPKEVPMLMDRLNAVGAFGPKPADEYGVFKFMLAAEKNNTARTQWLMRFYDWAIFHTWTLPAAEVSPGDTGMPDNSDFAILR